MLESNLDLSSEEVASINHDSKKGNAASSHIEFK
jgi:hypothetical protein